MNISPFLRLLPAFGMLFSLVSPLSADVIINDSSWTQGVSTRTGDSSGLNYYGSSGFASYSLNGDDFRIDAAGRGVSVNFATQTLSNIGDSLSLSYTFTITGSSNSTSTVRTGIFNQNTGTAISGYNYTNNFGTNYLGYQVVSNPTGTSGSATGFYEKIQSANVLTSSSSVANYTAIAAAGSSARPTLVEATTYTTTFTLTRVASGLQLDYSLTGGTGFDVYSLSFTDETPSTYSYTTIEFRGGSGTYTTQTISNFNLTFTPVPEPSASLLLLGGLAGTWLVMRRRRV